MEFDSLYREVSRQQLLLVDGIADGKITKGSDVVSPVVVLVEKGVQFPSDSGLTMESRIVGSLLVEEVGRIAKGNKIECGGEFYSVFEVLDDDGFIVRAFLRGSTTG